MSSITDNEHLDKAHHYNVSYTSDLTLNEALHIVNKYLFSADTVVVSTLESAGDVVTTHWLRVQPMYYPSLRYGNKLITLVITIDGGSVGYVLRAPSHSTERDKRSSVQSPAAEPCFSTDGYQPHLPSPKLVPVGSF